MLSPVAPVAKLLGSFQSIDGGSNPDLFVIAPGPPGLQSDAEDRGSSGERLVKKVADEAISKCYEFIWRFPKMEVPPNGWFIMVYNGKPHENG